MHATGISSRATLGGGVFLGLLAAGALSIAQPTHAASHREAPFITTAPKADGTDFYTFRSYEPGRENFVTLIADYQPFQTRYGGPNFFTLDPNALYEIHIDNDGDAREDLTFQFRFKNEYRDIKVPAGAKSTSVPLINIAPITQFDPPANVLNVRETFTLSLVRGDRRGNGAGRQPITHAQTGAREFLKPVDNIGGKSIADYAGYAGQHIYPITLPGCNVTGKVFVGQRKEPFYVNLGEVFDLINTNPVGPRDAEPNILDDDNITSLALELPISCLTKANEPVIGAWTTASLRQGRLLNAAPRGANDASREGGPWSQVSRLGMPLVNEVVIGVKDKDRFNSSKPKDDAQFLDYVTNPSFPVLINALFPIPATTPPSTPRSDLVAVFLTGVAGLNQPANVRPAEMLRLNTSIAPTPLAQQKDLGVIGGDLAGYPNGRRPIDDIVDISLRAVLGVLNPAGPDHPAAADLVTDGAQLPGAAAGQGAVDFGAAFPYLNPPVAGSPVTK